MIRELRTISILIVILITGWQLCNSIERRADIKLGNEIISNIESFQKTNGLPENNDWERLKELGFKDKVDFLEPDYQKLDESTFELTYLKGFDEPYLMWNSNEKIWKEGFPTPPGK